MGQRFQIYLNVPNPAKNFRRHDEPGNISAIFGDRETAVLAFYHQLIYGATAVNVAYNLLNFVRQNRIEQENHNYELLNSPDFSYCRSLQNYLNCWEYLLSVLPEGITGNGRKWKIETFSFLNREGLEFWQRFDRCANNDGVLIVDVMTMKYCFMDIPDSDIKHLKKFFPLSARVYYRSYYPKENTDEITAKFEPFELLTLDEVKAIFPAMAQTLDEYNKPATGKKQGNEKE